MKELIEFLESKYGYKVFGVDINKDEIKKNATLFVYNDKGEISKADTQTEQYYRTFYLSLITREREEIDEIELIKSVRKYGLLFYRTEIDYGKIENLDQDAQMTTFVFRTVIKVCY